MNKTMPAVVVAGTTNLDSAGVVELLVAIDHVSAKLLVAVD